MRTSAAITDDAMKIVHAEANAVLAQVMTWAIRALNHRSGKELTKEDFEFGAKVVLEMRKIPNKIVLRGNVLDRRDKQAQQRERVMELAMHAARGKVDKPTWEELIKNTK